MPSLPQLTKPHRKYTFLEQQEQRSYGGDFQLGLVEWSPCTLTWRCWGAKRPQDRHAKATAVRSLDKDIQYCLAQGAAVSEGIRLLETQCWGHWGQQRPSWLHPLPPHHPCPQLQAFQPEGTGPQSSFRPALKGHRSASRWAAQPTGLLGEAVTGTFSLHRLLGLGKGRLGPGGTGQGPEGPLRESQEDRA